MWGGGKSANIINELYSKDYLSPLLSTSTNKVEWGDDFNEIFSVNMDKIYFEEDIDATIEFKKPTEEEYDEEEGMYYLDSFTISIKDSKKSIEYKSPTRLFINNKIIEKNNEESSSDLIQISSASFYSDFIFSYQPVNNELTKSLQQILDLVESNEHLGCKTYDELVNKFADLLIENGLDYINLVHIEMICAVLIKNKEDGKRVDFSKELIDEYKIERVSKSVLGAPLAVCLSFERINDQLIDLNTYEKTETSEMDYLFR